MAGQSGSKRRPKNLRDATEFLVSLFLRRDLYPHVLEWALYSCMRAFRKRSEGIGQDATEDLLVVKPYQFVTQFRGIVERRLKEDAVDHEAVVAWFGENFTYQDWMRAVQWCGIEKVLGLFAGGRAPEKDDIENTLQDYGLTPEETKVLGLGWLKDVVDLEKAHKLKGLGWIKPQPDAQWRWIEFLLRTAGIKSDVAFPAVGGAKEVRYQPEALSRIWSTVARIFFEDMAKASLREDRKTSWTWAKNKREIEDLKDEYRTWMLGRAIACETKRMLAQAGGSGSETLTVHYKYQGQSVTFQAVKGDLTRKDVDSYHEKLVKEVGLLLQSVRVGGDPVAEVIRKLREAGDRGDLYTKLVVPGKAATAGWSDIGKLASSTFASYMSEEQRLALLEALGGVVMMATEARTAGKVGRARDILHVLTGKKADPAEMIAAKAYVDGDVSKGQKDRLLSPFLGGIVATLSGLRRGGSLSGGAGGGTGVSSGGGVSSPARTPAPILYFVAKLGHNIQNFFEEHIFWISFVTVFPFMLRILSIRSPFWEGLLALGLTALAWWAILKPLSNTGLWWLTMLTMLGLLIYTVIGSTNPIVRINWAKIPKMILGGETGGKTGEEIFNQPLPTLAP